MARPSGTFVPEKYESTGGDQGQVRSRKLVLFESEHQAGWRERVTEYRFAVRETSWEQDTSRTICGSDTQPRQSRGVVVGDGFKDQY